MAYILTPRFAPAYLAPQCNSSGFCAPSSRPAYTYRVSRPQPRRPQYSSFNHFFSQVDELLGEIDREAHRQAQLEAHVEAQREAHRQRQQRKRALRAQFVVNQNDQGWQVVGDIQGFEQEHITIEVTDEHTLKIAANTEWQSEKTQVQADAPPAIEQAAERVSGDKTHSVTRNEPEAETTTGADTAALGPDSDTESHKSYQATVEDDFEDLGAETSSLISASSASSTVSEPEEPKGKENAVEEPTTTETIVAPQPQNEAPAQQQEQPQEHERVHGSFERTFQFPKRIDAANVKATFKDGVLSITVPRAQVQQIRSIAIL